ncbi:MAG: ribonuclease P protein component [Candidatus Paceibacterota bacterium]
MLPKKHKATSAQVEALKKIPQKKTHHSPSFTLLVYKKRDQKEVSTITFIISKKIATKAVLRNKLKRRGYSVAQELFFRIQTGFTLVFYFKKESVHKTHKEFFLEIQKLLKEAHVL